ncbi:MAG: ROK family protein [Gemmatimonadales bacterium]
MRYIVGVDIGGTNIVVGTVSEDGTQIHGIRTDPTHAEEGAPGVLARISVLVEDSIQATLRATGLTREVIVGVGVGAPGPLDRARGLVLLTPNLGWRELPLRDLVSDMVHLSATLDNDANCAIYGEWWVGAAKGARFVVGLTIGTGIGGGIVIDGKIYHGVSDIAGEIGHTTIDSTGRLCKCGNYGCLEAYASGPAIAARAVEGITAGVATRLPEFVAGDLSRITAQTVYEAARHEDEFALELVRETAKFLGAGVANLVNIFNPEVIVLVGGVTLAGDRLFVPLRAEVKRRAFKPAVDRCRILPGALPGTAGVFGAAATFKLQTWGQA